MSFYGYWIASRVDIARTRDFYVYYVAAAAFADGADAYALSREQFAAFARALGVPSHTFPYYYPPLTAVLVWPLTMLGPQKAALVWLVASAAAMIGAAWLLGRSSEHAFGPALALCLLVPWAPVLETLNVGQVNGLLFLSLAAALFFGVRGRPWLAGGALALGALVKVVPIAHAALLGWQRRVAALGGVLAGLALGYLACAPLVGTHVFPDTTRAVTRFGMTTRANQALSGIVFRALPDSSLATPVWAVGAVLLLLGTVASCAARPTTPQRLRLEFSLVTAAITLIMPYTYAHQFVVVLLPLFVLIERALTDRAWRWMLVVLVPLATVATLSNVHGLPLGRMKDAYFWLCLACWILLVVALRTRPAAAGR